MRTSLRVFAWVGGVVLAALIVLAAPIVYVETACTSEPRADHYAPIISDPSWRRPEARTFLTYPEWQMVYAYDEFAAVLSQHDEHRFGYWRSLSTFWSSYCAMNRHAGSRGGADADTRAMLYTIGSSFNIEVGLKALYEETLGRAVAAIRGPGKTPQDAVAAEMARAYGAFLHQTPWYKFPFAHYIDALWEAPLEGAVRGWERRLALGAEWAAKRAYAGAIARAVEATGKDQLRIRSVVAGLSAERLREFPGVTLIESAGGRLVIESDRYAEFTKVLKALSAAGADIVEIAGNDDIMVSALRDPKGPEWPGDYGELLLELALQGANRSRLLVLVKVGELAALIRRAPELGAEIEHVYDY